LSDTPRRLSVRALAALVHRRGDLFARLDSQTRPVEGIRAQQRLQRQRGAGYECERPVALLDATATPVLSIQGRLDGCDLTQTPVLVEEIKTTRADADRAHAHLQSLHWAQLRLYAALLQRELGDGAPAEGWRLQLTYVHPDSGASRAFEERWTAAALDAYLEDTLAHCRRWLRERQQEADRRDHFLAQRDFPYGGYRPHQRALARRVFGALRDGEGLALEAPTGSGKTMGLLFPAARALAAGHCEQVIFLTSRGTGARAALSALEDLDPAGQALRRVQITAKAEACPVAGMPCDPERCDYAAGYYDRHRDAVAEVLDAGHGDRARLAAIAEAHRVCPFELSVDAARWADVVVGDYNYVFDPLVQLGALTDERDAALLVDESHQLGPRVQAMLSLRLQRSALRDARDEDPTTPAVLRKALDALDRALGRACAGAAAQGETEVDPPATLFRALARLRQAQDALPPGWQSGPRLSQLLMELARWQRAEDWFDQAHYLFSAEHQGRERTLRLHCLDPGAYLKQALGRYRSHVRFSGTLSPLPLYQRQHGQSDGPAERAGSPFRAEQLAVLLVPDVDVRLRQREASLPRLLDLTTGLCRARPGRYLVALPSFAYLDRFVERCAAQAGDLELVVQSPAMDDAARQHFLSTMAAPLTDLPARSRLGVVVLGGVFGESVDFGSASLAGVICVSIGLAPPTLAREAQLARCEAGEGFDGYDLAYRLPAMTRVLQMAGRLLRGPGDRGVLCLVDARFRDPRIQRYFPAHWQPRTTPAAAVAAAAAAFWYPSQAPPRLAAAEVQEPA